ncbi:hypothetical protein CDD81_4896 [Ophiocordyceps australis]|uniref:Uncharacterized protein n=1 Tax=Ophiocordyceps australis TaxID=1399860 RepID=A0A2C5XA88_9HYPO|nr:hypothetical protein CDD81_4896 [Ophiocordyceps australis]
MKRVLETMQRARALAAASGSLHKRLPTTTSFVQRRHNHATTKPFTGISATRDGFLGHVSQTAQTLGQVSAHDFHGIVVDEGERASLAEHLGESDTLLLRPRLRQRVRR